MEAKTLLLVIAIITVIVLVAVLIIQKNKVKSALESLEKDKKALEDKEKILYKEAKIKAVEELQEDREQLNEEERERRQEIARQEQKLAKREDVLEDKIQEYTEKDLQAQRKMDQLLEKEDYLAELVQKQTEELERISGMSCEEAKRTALEKLIVDGRIHPVRIEEMVEKAREEIDKKIWSEGENAALEMGVMGLNKELIKTLGRLYYRTSYGQNVLKHSLEVGHIAGMLAAELGANEKIAKRAGLLHDIGKAVDQTQEGTHIQLGVELATRYGERAEVIHAIEAHHDDIVANTIEAVLVKVADAISAGRPGARRDTLEIYIKRLQKIEEIVNSYEGIKQSFAVQAGREVRIIVQAEMFDDLASGKLARDVAKRIENELDYPGQIRVTVVREFRTTEIAK